MATLAEIASKAGVRLHPPWFSKVTSKYEPMPHQHEMLELYARNTRYMDAGEPGCVSADTEFLTPNGWKRIDEYVEGDLVAQVCPVTWKEEFVYPLAYIKESCSQFFKATSCGELSMVLCPEHRVLYYDNDGRYFVETMERFVYSGGHETKQILTKPDEHKLVTVSDFEIVKSGDGYKYCFQVPSSFLLLRHDGHVFVTGNCGKTLPAQIHGLLMAGLGNKVVYTMPPKLVDQFIEEMLDHYAGILNYVSIGNLNVPAAQKRKLVEQWNQFGWPDILFMSYDGYREWNDINKKKKIGANQWYYEDGTKYDPVARGQAFTKDGRRVDRKGYAENDKHRLLTKKGYRVYFFDEAHALCGVDSIISRSVEDTAQMETAIYLMTGTPVPTVPSDAYGIIRVINPDAYFSESSFMRQHVITRPMSISRGTRKVRINVPCDYINVDKIHEELFKNARRIQKRQVSKLPDPIISEVPVTLTGKHRKLYKDFMRDHFALYGDTIVEAESQAQVRHMSLQLISCPTAFNPEVPMKNDLFDTFSEVLTTINPKENKVVVFAYYKEAIKFLQRELAEYNPATLYGETMHPSQEINRFKNDDDCRVIIVNWLSGGAGLNLQVASHIVFYECPTSPKDAKQAIARCDRTGQHNIVNAYFLRVKNTLSDRNFKKLMGAEERVNEILRDEFDLLYRDIK